MNSTVNPAARQKVIKGNIQRLESSKINEGSAINESDQIPG
jgi:hypothetical protein